MPIQHESSVISNSRAGAYHLISLTAGDIPKSYKPGQFVTLSIDGLASSLILRRSFSIYQAQDRGVYGGSIEIVVAAHGEGTKWITQLRRNDSVNIVGPLGKPFPIPKDPVSCILIGGGYGSAPLFRLAEALKNRGCRVDFILGAQNSEKLFGLLEARRLGHNVVITTADGSAGQTGFVTDPLPELIEKTSSQVIYSCGPMPMLSAITEIAKANKIYSFTAVEEAMACGIGVCMTCVLPVIGEDGVTRMLRSCVDGPIFNGEKVRWSDVGTVPSETFGSGNH
jgi:dihydroorotate dehydrogenase electron transfer subunit